MSTRTTGKRETVEERCEARIRASWKRKGMKVSVTPYFAALPVSHIRAELQRVARQVRKLDMKLINSPVVLRRDVLALLKEAGR